MNLDEIKHLIELVTEKDLAEFEYESSGEKIRISRDAGNHSTPSPPYVVVSTSGAAPASVTHGNSGQLAGPAPEAAPAPRKSEEPPEKKSEDEDLVMVTSPIVGTFYEASSPGAEPLVRVGDHVEPGRVLCIIEAMKLMNEIEAEQSGVIVKRFVANAQPVEYGEALFAIRPDS